MTDISNIEIFLIYGVFCVPFNNIKLLNSWQLLFVAPEFIQDIRLINAGYGLIDYVWDMYIHVVV